MADGTLSKIGCLIVSMVSILTKSGRPCWANNAYIARSVRVTPEAVANELSKLVKSGVLVRDTTGNRRILKLGVIIKIMNDEPETGAETFTKIVNHNKRKENTDTLNKRNADAAPRRAATPTTPYESSVDTSTMATKEHDTVASAELVPPLATDKDKEDHLTEEHHRLLNDRIRDFAKEHNWVPARSPSAGAKQLGRMERQLAPAGITFVKMIRVWAWYETNYIRVQGSSLKKELPRIVDGDDFRSRFQWILDRIEKEAKSVPIPTGTISVEAKEVVANLENLDWCEAAKPQLGPAVQRSIDNVRGFVSDLNTVPDDLRYARDRVLDHIGEASDYVKKYFCALFHRWNGWDGWGGNLIRLTWTSRAESFVNPVRAAISRSTGSEADFNRLIAFLNRPEKQS